MVGVTSCRCMRAKRTSIVARMTRPCFKHEETMIFPFRLAVKVRMKGE